MPVYLEVLVVVAVHVEPRVVDGEHRPVRQLEIVPRARLVAERPQVDGRMVLEELDHAHTPLDLRLRPRRRVRQRLHTVVRAVRLHVRLALHVQAHPVAQVVHVRVVRIVRRPERIEIAALHQANVLRHLVARDGASVHRRGVVAVHALELDGFAVDQYLAVRRKAHALHPDLA